MFSLTFLGGLDWTVLPGKEMIGKSSARVGGGDEVAGVLEADVPFPPAHMKHANGAIKKIFLKSSYSKSNLNQLLVGSPLQK